MKKALTISFFVFFATIDIAFAQQAGDDWKGSFEPNAAHPFGRLNPAAPEETTQFAFMIGEFDCADEIIDPQTGKWIKMPAIWNAKYFLNGHGIIDHYWSPAFYTSNIRIFDASDKKWKVTFFRMPGFTGSSEVSGEMEGENLVMRQGTKENGGAYTFYNISEKGFDWVGENIKDGKASKFWTSSCTRRTH